MSILKKYEGNPIIKPTDLPEGIMYVLNPGVIKVDNEYIMMMDAATLAQPIVLWIARSKDGVHFVADPEPVEWPEPDPIHPEDCIYDPRITQIDNEYYICYASSNCQYGVRVGIVKTLDFKKFERVSIASEQGNRNAVLFPEKIDGLYVRMDRPFGSERDQSGIWLSYSPDLVYWGKCRPLMEPREGLWDDFKIGAGAVPIKTEQGWLTIYHGVSSTINGCIYRLGVCLLDLNDPSKVIARGEDAILWSENDFEMYGRVSNVVFTCNAILEEDGIVRIYYGAADKYIGLAQGRVEDLIQACFQKNPYILKNRLYHRNNNTIL